MRIFFLFVIFAGAAVILTAPPKTIYAGETTSAGSAPVAAPAEPVAPGAFIRDFYNAALALGGLIGFGALVYGAIMYSVAGGNSASAHEARDQITQALLGLVLLFASYLVLATINPSLVKNLDLPPLQALNVPTDTNTKPLPPCGGSTRGTCPVGGVNACHRGSNGQYSCSGYTTPPSTTCTPPLVPECNISSAKNSCGGTYGNQPCTFKPAVGCDWVFTPTGKCVSP